MPQPEQLSQRMTVLLVSTCGVEFGSFAGCLLGLLLLVVLWELAIVLFLKEVNSSPLV